MKTPTPAQFCELQLKIAAAIQQQLVAAIEANDYSSVTAICRTLKDITGSYRDISGSNPTPGRVGLSLGYGSFTEIENGNSKNFLETPIRERRTPTIPTSYAYPDGFEGVTLREKNDGEDVWDEQ